MKATSKNKSKWIEKGKELPDENKNIQCKDSYGKIYLAILDAGKERPLQLNDLLEADFFTHWRYVK